MDFCYRCHDRGFKYGEDYRLIEDTHGHTCCNNCGLVINYDTFDRSNSSSFKREPQYSITSSATTTSSFPESFTISKGVNTYPNKSKYRKDYFTDVLNSISFNAKTLPNDLLEEIYRQLKINHPDKIKKIIRRQDKRSIKEALRFIIIPAFIGDKYISRSTKKPLFKISRKNHCLSWVSILEFILKKEKVKIGSLKINKMEDDLIDLINEERGFIMDAYEKKRHECGILKTNSILPYFKCGCRKSTPNVPTMISFILFMLNPIFMEKYMKSISLPKLKTFKKNISLLISMFQKMYGNCDENIRIGHLNRIRDFKRHIKIINENILNEKNKEKIEKWMDKVISTKVKEDYLSVMINTLAPLFYPTTYWNCLNRKNMRALEKKK